MSGREALYAHLASGITTVCHCWLVTRRDGAAYGFTDHDQDLTFGGSVFKASSGLTAGALQQTTGLSVDNTEAVGALSDASVTEADLAAGRFDGAEVKAWLVNWANPFERVVDFRGQFGEIQRKAGSFRAELRGLTDRLGQPQGRIYQAGCSAVLGDHHCGVDLAVPAYRVEVPVAGFDALGRIAFSGLAGYADRWFERGTVTALAGAAVGLATMIKADQSTGTGRLVELWHQMNAPLAVGDLVRLQAGCDKRAETCRMKFLNFVNFRGFPHVPGEDWLASYPASSKVNDGGSLQQ
jgi:uncharacterized phage protein (TIGR02218 family)